MHQYPRLWLKIMSSSKYCRLILLPQHENLSQLVKHLVSNMRISKLSLRMEWGRWLGWPSSVAMCCWVAKRCWHTVVIDVLNDWLCIGAILGMSYKFFHCELTWISNVQAIKVFLEQPKHDNISHFAITPLSLKVLADICRFLYFSHVVQEIVSAEKTLTLSIILPIYKDLLVMFMNLQTKLPKIAHAIGMFHWCALEWSLTISQSSIWPSNLNGLQNIGLWLTTWLCRSQYKMQQVFTHWLSYHFSRYWNISKLCAITMTCTCTTQYQYQQLPHIK